MKRILAVLLITGAACVTSFGKADGPRSIAQVEDGQLSELEKELVPLAEAMPDEKYNFAPSSGDFKNVRTFALQMRHIATVMYEASAGLLGEKVPVPEGSTENGSDALNSKAAVVQYLKNAFGYAHRAVATLTTENATEVVEKPWKSSRLALANVLVWHSYDHYGQAVVYLRMNGIVPPSSR